MAERQRVGTYEVETDEEALEGLSGRTAYRRVAMLLIPTESGCTRTIVVDPVSLKNALDAGQAGAERADEP